MSEGENGDSTVTGCRGLDVSFCNDVSVYKLIVINCNSVFIHSIQSVGTFASNYADRYSDASATWVVSCAILMFFMV